MDNFASRWSQKEQECGFDECKTEMITSDINLPCLNPASKQLLRESGLPLSAAPFLSFTEVSTMSHIYEVYSPGDWWSEEMKTLLAPYRMIGSDDSGNPICIDESTGKIWIFDHEVKFLARQFMNSSIAQLAECLLAYMGVDEDNTSEFHKIAFSIDPRAVSNKSFWDFRQKMNSQYWADYWAEDPNNKEKPGLLSRLRKLFGFPEKYAQIESEPEQSQSPDEEESTESDTAKSPVLSELKAFIRSFAKANGLSESDVFENLGIAWLTDPPERDDYAITPINSITFAHTGGDGVHYGFVGKVSLESPIVMTVPSADNGNVIVGENLHDFLCLGCCTSYFWLEQLVYDYDETVGLLQQASDIYYEKLNVSDWLDENTDLNIDDPVFKALRMHFDLHPWKNVNARLEYLKDKYAGSLVIEDLS